MIQCLHCYCGELEFIVGEPYWKCCECGHLGKHIERLDGKNMEGEVIKEVEQKKTEGFIEDKPKILDWKEVKRKLRKGETVTIPKGEYVGKINDSQGC